MKKFSKYVDVFVSISKATSKNLKNKLSITEDKIRLVYNFVDLDRFFLSKKDSCNEQRKKYGFKEADFIV
jgi:hypothetical protein